MFDGDTSTLVARVRSAHAPADCPPWLQVHRNTVWLGWLSALQAQFPSVHTWLANAFDDIARTYLLQHPPSQPVLLDIGKPFPQWLSSHALQDAAVLASLDLAWARAHGAADASLLSATQFAALWASPDSSLTLHPSLEIFPIDNPALLTFWLRHRFAAETSLDNAEALLIHRVDERVQAEPITAATHAFFDAAKRGQTALSCIGAALSAQPDLDLGAWGQWLLDQQCLCATSFPAVC